MKPRMLCILGRQPSIGRAELETIYGPEKVIPVGDYGATINDVIGANVFLRLGGTIKCCEILVTLSKIHSWEEIEKYFLDNLTQYISLNSEAKLQVGIS